MNEHLVSGIYNPDQRATQVLTCEVGALLRRYFRARLIVVKNLWDGLVSVTHEEEKGLLSSTFVITLKGSVEDIAKVDQRLQEDFTSS